MTKEAVDKTVLVNCVDPYIEAKKQMTKAIEIGRASLKKGSRRQKSGPKNEAITKSGKLCEGHPWDFSNSDLLIVETIDITSIIADQSQLHIRKAKVIAIQEHAAVGKDASAAVLEVNGNGWNLQLGPAHPELARKTGGVRYRQRRTSLRYQSGTSPKTPQMP